MRKVHAEKHEVHIPEVVVDGKKYIKIDSLNNIPRITAQSRINSRNYTNKDPKAVFVPGSWYLLESEDTYLPNKKRNKRKLKK